MPPPPSKAVILRRAIDKCKVIEEDENVHSRQQRQIDLVVVAVAELLREAE